MASTVRASEKASLQAKTSQYSCSRKDSKSIPFCFQNRSKLSLRT